MTTWRDEAIVLGSRKSSEANRVVFLLTEHHGKTVVAANGARKSRNGTGARLAPMNHVDVLIRPSRGMATVEEVRLATVQHRLHSDLVRLTQGLAMLEVVDKMTPEGEPVPRIYSMLRGALATLEENGSPLVVGAFYWKLLELEGAGPVTDRCVRCGTTEGLDRFDVVEGGAACGGCGSGAAVSPAGLAVVAMVLGGRLREALDLDDSPAVREANNLAMNAMEAHLERGIRSLGVFDRHL